MISWILLDLATLSLFPDIHSGLLSRPMCEKNFKDGKKFRGQNHPNLLMPAVPEAVILLELSPHTCCIHSSLCAVNPRKNLRLRTGCGT